MIKVLVVDDVVVNQHFLTHLINSDPALHVVGVASNGEEAIDLVQRLKPDVITMDLYMPKVDGYEATQRIMELQPTPIIIVSGHPTAKDAASSFRLMEAGAVSIVLRPPGPEHPDHHAAAAELTQTIRLMSEVRVVGRPRNARPAPRAALDDARPRSATARTIVAIGASTGGPLTLQKILKSLDGGLGTPILIVQHIASGFTPGFVEWLSSTTSYPVRVARNGELPLAGHAHVAPDGWHMVLSAGNRIRLTSDPPVNGLRPAVSRLFQSVADMHGATAIAILLSGMGRDGADEMRILRDLGALTIAQDAASSVVHGMPGEAIRINAARQVLSPDEIASLLKTLLPPATPT